MQYKVTFSFYDEDYYVEADDEHEAFQKAYNEMNGSVPMYCDFDIEELEDEEE